MSVSLKKPGEDNRNDNDAGSAPIREYTPEHILTEEQASTIYGQRAAYCKNPEDPVREYTPEHVMDEAEASPSRPEQKTRATSKTKTETSIHIGILDMKIETERESKAPAKPDISVLALQERLKEIEREGRAFRRSQITRALISMTVGLLCMIGSRFITPETLPADSVASKLAAMLGSASGLILPVLGAIFAIYGISIAVKLIRTLR